METTKIEVANIERTLADAIENEMRELSDLQLSLIGGGIGEVIVG
jgi:hypothetical protein